MKNYKALVIRKEKKIFSLKIEKINFDPVNSDEVMVKVEYSSINFKDLLVCSGNPALVRKFPHVPGIDAAGTVFKSNSKKFKVGEKVAIIARPLGIKSPGGFSEFVTVPFNWLTKLPKNITTKKSMILGTAGFTAMFAINLLISFGLKKSKLPVLVTGATGGVGVYSIIFLKKMGFTVHASTTRSNKNNFLKKIGVKEIILHNKFSKMSDMPLLNKRYAGIIDNVGGNFIFEGSKQLIENGIIASIGNVAGDKTTLSLMPLILRGVKILGINAESASLKERSKIWKFISKYSKNIFSTVIYKEHDFKNIDKLIKSYKNLYGRNIISIK